MRIQPVNYSTNKPSVSPSHKANLWVCKSVKDVIKPNEKAFLEAAEMCENWLKNEMGHIFATMTIRKNTALVPKVAIERYENEYSYAYPHEELGHYVTKWVQHHENLEFEVNNHKCGFWLDKDSDANKLLSDFKNMFNYLNK